MWIIIIKIVVAVFYACNAMQSERFKFFHQCGLYVEWCYVIQWVHVNTINTGSLFSQIEHPCKWDFERCLLQLEVKKRFGCILMWNFTSPCTAPNGFLRVNLVRFSSCLWCWSSKDLWFTTASWYINSKGVVFQRHRFYKFRLVLCSTVWILWE